MSRKLARISPENVDDYVNHSSPIRFAMFGGAKTGKTSTVSKLALGNFSDTYYPTIRTNPVLINYNTSTPEARMILDDTDVEHTLNVLSKDPLLLLSPAIYQSYSKIPQNGKKIASGKLNLNSKNQYYMSYFFDTDLEVEEYVPPHISPILVDLIDTPAFDPQRVVPFLEISLDSNLGPKTLRGLADAPRTPVSTSPLLVASGASELNGNVDGYFLTYSAVPSHQPPSYEEISSPVEDPETCFAFLQNIKDALYEAWREYISFKIRWQLGKESDIFSFKSALKNMWQEPEAEADLIALSKDINLCDVPEDPSDPNSHPPIWILCTHTAHPLALPMLIEGGIQLARTWKCGFIGIDNTEDGAEVALAAAIREVIERKKMQKGKARA